MVELKLSKENRVSFYVSTHTDTHTLFRHVTADALCLPRVVTGVSLVKSIDTLKTLFYKPLHMARWVAILPHPCYNCFACSSLNTSGSVEAPSERLNQDAC